jgi:formylglycine-generating enzyme required for sulfatase activity
MRDNYKKMISFNLIVILLVAILFTGCSEQGGSSSGGGSSGGSSGEITYSLTGIQKRDMVSITGGAYIQTDGTNSFSHTISSFQFAKYEVTYELWYTVFHWALSNGYNFDNLGTEGNNITNGAPPTSAKYEPVLDICWCDTIVWCNAYSEMAGLTPCYTYSGSTIKDSTNAGVCDNAVCNWTANGYRLPTEGEWQFAASNKGSTIYNWASGAATYSTDIADVNPVNGVVDGKDANDVVAVYGKYWNGSWIDTGVWETSDVGTKTANALSIFDMSGNAYEWCWDWYDTYPLAVQSNYRGPGNTTDRIIRGGSYYGSAVLLQVGRRNWFPPDGSYEDTGFRVARSN